MVLRRGLGNVSCIFMCTLYIYGLWCRVELHKTHLLPAGFGSHTDWDHCAEDLDLVGFLGGAKKRQAGNVTTEKHIGDRSKCVKLIRTSKERKEWNNFDVSVAGTEIIQSYFHSLETEKGQEENEKMQFQVFLDIRIFVSSFLLLSTERLCWPNEPSDHAAFLMLALNQYTLREIHRDEISREELGYHSLIG